MRLYVESVGYEHGDAAATVVGICEKRVREAVDGVVVTMVTDTLNSECDETCERDCELHVPSIWTSGVFAEGALWTMHNVLGWTPGSPFGQLPAFTFDDLRGDVVYAEGA